ncbi:MAG: hypothetical protein GX279_05540 [Clostridiaceae bacterium]|jgi:hypothetical protein|nr:hypothetical protein [Clostridiaceae bacterium]
MILLVIFSYALLAVYEFVPLYKQKLWKDFWSNTVLWALSFTSAILLCFDIKIPSPSPFIKSVIDSIMGV